VGMGVVMAMGVGMVRAMGVVVVAMVVGPGRGGLRFALWGLCWGG
jgi:hypothetical protein